MFSLENSSLKIKSSCPGSRSLRVCSCGSRLVPFLAPLSPRSCPNSRCRTSLNRAVLPDADVCRVRPERRGPIYPRWQGNAMPGCTLAPNAYFFPTPRKSEVPRMKPNFGAVPGPSRPSACGLGRRKLDLLVGPFSFLCIAEKTLHLRSQMCATCSFRQVEVMPSIVVPCLPCLADRSPFSLPIALEPFSSSSTSYQCICRRRRNASSCT